MCSNKHSIMRCFMKSNFIRRTNTTEKSMKSFNMLPLHQVVLHNDNTNSVSYITKQLVHIAKLSRQDSILVTEEAHQHNSAIVTVVHLELAELYQEQFSACGITTSIEPWNK